MHISQKGRYEVVFAKAVGGMGCNAVKMDKVWISVDGRAKVIPFPSANGRTRAVVSHSKTSHAELFTLGIILAALQVIDGILTGLGMAHYGTGMEGNVLLRTLMVHIGYVPALIITKALALGVIAGLCHQTVRVSWLKGALTTIIVMYAVFAVLPWTYLLTRDLLLG
jgi:hypothetical protein